jgi:hypothetical protein
MKLSRVVLAAAMCSGLVFAQTTATSTTAKPAAAKPAAVKALKVSGTVESVDAIGNVLIVKPAKAKAALDTFSVGTETKIETGAKKAVALADLKTGENVSVHYKVEEGKKLATEVVVGAAAAPKKAATAPAAEPAKAQ